MQVLEVDYLTLQELYGILLGALGHIVSLIHHNTMDKQLLFLCSEGVLAFIPLTDFDLRTNSKSHSFFVKLELVK